MTNKPIAGTPLPGGGCHYETPGGGSVNRMDVDCNGNPTQAARFRKGASGGSDPHGQQIRSLVAAGGGAAAGQPGCSRTNLRGECANPNLIGEYGNMSWREYDDIKAKGQDPRAVSDRNLNKPVDTPYSRLAQKNQGVGGDNFKRFLYG